jgi:hypothetical protein
MNRETLFRFGCDLGTWKTHSAVGIAGMRECYEAAERPRFLARFQSVERHLRFGQRRGSLD